MNRFFKEDANAYPGSTGNSAVVDEGRIRYQTGRHHWVLLPDNCSSEVDRLREAVARAELEEVERKQAEIEATETATGDNEPGIDSKTPTKPVGAAESDTGVDLPAWARQSGQDPRSTTAPAFLHCLFSKEAIDKVRASSKSRHGADGEYEAFTNHLYRLLDNIGGTRQLARVDQDWRAQLDALGEEMPNFTEVLRYLRAEITLAEAAGTVPFFAPILLNGPPGTGKTMFGRRLAEFFASGFLSISMETAQTSSALSGSEAFWSNTKPGEFFGLMTQGEFANPVVLLDEIDKVGGDRYNPAAALYTLLEPAAAKTWHDLTIPALTLDVSRVTWILTSNSLDTIASPLRSRMKIFSVPPFTVAQSREMARRIFRRVAQDIGLDFNPDLPIPMAAVLATVSPREIHRIARELVANAVSAGRRQVQQSDLAETDFDAATLNQWQIVSDQVAAAEGEQRTRAQLH